MAAGILTEGRAVRACMQILSLLRPAIHDHVPSGSWWAWGEPLTGSGLAGPAVQSLAITPGKVSRHRSRGAGFRVVIAHVQHDHRSINLEPRRVWEVYGVHIK